MGHTRGGPNEIELTAIGVELNASCVGDWNVVNSGDWGGVMVSADGGANWRMTTFPANFYVTSIVAPAPGERNAACRLSDEPLLCATLTCHVERGKGVPSLTF